MKSDNVLNRIRDEDIELDIDSERQPRSFHEMFNIKNPKWQEIVRQQQALWKVLTNYVRKRMISGE